MDWNCNLTRPHKNKTIETPSHNVPPDICTQRRFRSVCAFAQSDQNLHWAHFGLQRIQSLHADNHDSDQTARKRRLILRWEQTSEGTFFSRCDSNRIWALLSILLSELFIFSRLQHCRYIKFFFFFFFFFFCLLLLLLQLWEEWF